MEPSETLKRVVGELCNETGTKQKYWAKKCGYSEKKFSLLLNGHRAITVFDIKKLCKGLNKSPDDLIEIEADTA